MILVVVDVQHGLDDAQYGTRNNPDCESNVAALLAGWREAGLPVVFTRHFSSRAGSPLEEGSPGSEIKTSVAPAPGERVHTKRTNSAFKNPDFEREIAAAALPLVLVGIATDACVTATAREAKDLGHDVSIVVDACATFDRHDPAGKLLPADLVHRVALAALGASGIRLLTVGDAMAFLANG